MHVCFNVEKQCIEFMIYVIFAQDLLQHSYFQRDSRFKISRAKSLIIELELSEDFLVSVIVIFEVRKMVGQEGRFIEKVQIEVPVTVSKGGAPFPYSKEWVI